MPAHTSEFLQHWYKSLKETDILLNKWHFKKNKIIHFKSSRQKIPILNFFSKLFDHKLINFS